MTCIFNFDWLKKIMQLTMRNTLCCCFHHEKTCFLNNRKSMCVQLSTGSLNHATHNACQSHFAAASIVGKHAFKKKPKEQYVFRLSSGSLTHATHNAYHTSLSHARTTYTRHANTTPHTDTHNQKHTQSYRQTETKLDQNRNHKKKFKKKKTWSCFSFLHHFSF